ncbi:unnamed protein product [Calypogeia fissa]
MLVSPCLSPSLCSSSSCFSVFAQDQKPLGSKKYAQYGDVKRVAPQLLLLPTEACNYETDKRRLMNHYYYYWYGSSREARRPQLLLVKRRCTAAFSLNYQRSVIHYVRKSILVSKRKSGFSTSPHCLSPESLTSSNDLARRSSAVLAQRPSSRDALGLGSSSSPTVRETAYDAASDSSSSSPSAESNGIATAAAGIPSKVSSSGNWTFEYANTVGILGGLTPLATVDFMRKIVEATDLEDETDHIPLVLCSDPHTRKSISPSLLLPRTNNMSSKGGTSAMELMSVETLLARRRFLEKAGAKCIVMPCHVSHLWYDQLAEGCSVPFLHMADCVVEELKAANLQPLEAGSKPKIGVLGTQATIAAAEFYYEKLRSQGFDVALPDQATMEHAVIPGTAALRRGDMEGARNLLRIAVQVLLVNAVNLVLLACHDTPTAFLADDPVLRKCIDPTDALARATVRWSRSMKGIRT